MLLIMCEKKCNNLREVEEAQNLPADIECNEEIVLESRAARQTAVGW
jgi:hypothetical protein